MEKTTNNGFAKAGYIIFKANGAIEYININKFFKRSDMLSKDLTDDDKTLHMLYISRIIMMYHIVTQTKKEKDLIRYVKSLMDLFIEYEGKYGFLIGMEIYEEVFPKA